jgi:arabinogalactan endo-1,4-beta-galactosidase
MKTNQIFSLIAALLMAVPMLAQTTGTFWLGADISGTTQMESEGHRFYNREGQIRENTALMHELGLNAVRLRVWVNPRGGWSGADDVLRMAQRAQYYGMAVMIDFHYSDWWADPGKQPIPAAWQYLSYGEIKEKLREHTMDVLQLLRDHHIDVRWVQVGNETTHGFLWPVGRAENNMEQYAGLTQAGYEAVKAVYPEAKVIVHIDGGCDQKRYDFIFDGLKKYGTKWDMIGLSVYPYWDQQAKLEPDWQGTVRDFTRNIRHLYAKYGSETMVVETGAEAKKPQEGKKIMAAVIRAARHETDGHCHGVFYWAPELEGGYPLGAFQNGRPTEIMDAFSESAQMNK